ncbi:hypothetical protein [Dyadobacter sp. CY347]|uniref:hypothetical protein n=1 Tax=Dyadobacter sp. CY347 TaxID=2909336 RepID=UPI001F4822C6|nr:hypothetical protein [Dyadobacter sp. CY347]MCF2487830.1 hypothetical protein [Dyadobacter sp. CY347]
MKISNIFVIVRESLFAAKFQKQDRNEFARMFDLWNDAEFLEMFFEEHKQDLNAFWQHVTVKEAVIATMAEATSLERKLVAVARTGLTDRDETLSDLFRPLRNGTTRLEEFEKSKLRGSRRHSWLRLYAIRVDVNLFVVSGGAIKLTRTMNERSHLVTELKKLDLLRDYLGDESDELEVFEMY